MGIFRRLFTKQFKLAAVGRFVQEISIAETTRPLRSIRMRFSSPRDHANFAKEACMFFRHTDSRVGVSAGLPSWNGPSFGNR